ncbi:MAG: hypothetical protein KDE50_05885 [Caldilineaceae bacterium]|nr:hypothetical protein [Caldilineaceae bacterium]MCB0121448.1 hypothetical protein [Caldilineaceae bacterium]MCB0139423.1 hypothetical protein [Caldilineaceae bacterium]
MSAHFNTPIHHRHPIYAAYLVRFWQDAPNGPWRASAQSVQTGEIVRFGSSRALYEFLENEVIISFDLSQRRLNQQRTINEEE